VEKIKKTVEALFSDLGKNIDDTKEVRLYGNMSSATVLYVLERFMDNRLKEKRLNVKFWPWIFSTTCFIAV
jgi:predicted naringenin-chalcone synthase